MRSRTLIRTAAITAVVASLAGGTAASSYAHDNRRHQSPHAWPQRLIDRSPDLVQPEALTVDRSIGARRAAQEVNLAQQLYTFWNTGQQKYLDAAVSPRFKDNTLPAGRRAPPARSSPRRTSAPPYRT